MIEYIERPDDPAQKEMEQRYRNVFGSAEGKKVLGHMLKGNHFGVPLNTETERIEYNVVILIARMCGALEEIDRFLGIED